MSLLFRLGISVRYRKAQRSLEAGTGLSEEQNLKAKLMRYLQFFASSPKVSFRRLSWIRPGRPQLKKLNWLNLLNGNYRSQSRVKLCTLGEREKLQLRGLCNSQTPPLCTDWISSSLEEVWWNSARGSMVRKESIIAGFLFYPQGVIQVRRTGNCCQISSGPISLEHWAAAQPLDLMEKGSWVAQRGLAMWGPS